MSPEERRVLNIVRAAAPPAESGEGFGEGTVFVLGPVAPEEISAEAERLLDLILEHDAVVTW
jgi:hypothetical protein